MTLESRLNPADFDPLPGLVAERDTKFGVAAKAPKSAAVVGYAVDADGTGAAQVGVPFAALGKAGFTGEPGQSLAVPQPDGKTLVVALGAGKTDEQTVNAL